MPLTTDPPRPRTVRRLRWPLLWALLLLVAWVGGAAQAAQPPPITYERYDAELRVNADGTITVREIQQIRFDGAFRTAFAEIPRRLTSAISDVTLTEGDEPYDRGGSGPGSFQVEEEADSITVEWAYTETRPGEVRTFILEYTVSGGLWLYPDGDILEWRAVPEDRSGILVETSRITVTVPGAVTAATAFGPPFEQEMVGGQAIFAATEPIPDGIAFQVQVVFPHGLTGATRQPWQRREDEASLRYRLAALDVDLTLTRDGTVTVEEQQRISVTAGTMAEGQRRISLAGLDELRAVALWEGSDQRFAPATAPGCDYCFEMVAKPRASDWVRATETGITVDEARAGHIDLRWFFPALVRGEATTFRLRYEAIGAIQLLSDRQLLDWTVVYPDRTVAAERATVRLRLPPGVDPGSVTIDGQPPRPEADGSIVLHHTGPVAPGTPWRVRLGLPPQATNASLPAWQRDLTAAVAEMEAQRAAAAAAAARRAQQQLLIGALALFILVGGLVAVALAWYRWGRDAPTPRPAEYLAAPPSDLPPAVVAYLLDEAPSAQGALAALFQLATLGLLSIEPGEPLRLTRNWQEPLAAGTEMARPDGAPITIPPHLVTLFNGLREAIPRGQQTTLDTISRDFRALLPRVYQEMGEEALHYFEAAPVIARHRWLVAGQWLTLGAMAAGLVLLCLLGGELGPVALAPAGALALVGLVLVLASRWMARRSAAGAEEAARWRAFRRYLLDLKQFGTLGEAQAILDQHFAYAVALGVAPVLLREAERAGAALPRWTLPRPLDWQDSASSSSSGEQRSAEPTSAMPPPVIVEVPPPRRATEPPPRTLQGLSDGLARSVTGASDDLAALLSRATDLRPDDTPFEVVLRGAGSATRLTFEATESTLEIIGAILDATTSGGGSGGFSSGTSSSSRSSSRSHSSSRSSSSRRSGGGGRRGFG